MKTRIPNRSRIYSILIELLQKKHFNAMITLPLGKYHLYFLNLLSLVHFGSRHNYYLAVGEKLSDEGGCCVLSLL